LRFSTGHPQPAESSMMPSQSSSTALQPSVRGRHEGPLSIAPASMSIGASTAASRCRTSTPERSKKQALHVSAAPSTTAKAFTSSE
jgi:hypothetical protein